jgi:hypothetical protein
LHDRINAFFSLFLSFFVPGLSFPLRSFLVDSSFAFILLCNLLTMILEATLIILIDNFALGFFFFFSVVLKLLTSLALSFRT